jgi:pimeloyl-ACP methyl ester carboxylesterase
LSNKDLAILYLLMPEILLLHGALGSSAQLKPLSSALESRFSVYTYDLAGHGGTLMPDKFSIPDFSEEIISFLDQNKIEKISIFGYSMGGYIAAYIARHFPERVYKIATLATKYEWNPEIAQKEIRMLDVKKISEKVPAFAEQLRSRHQPNDWKTVVEKTSLLLTGLGNNEGLRDEDFSQISTAALLIAGDRDTMVTAEETISVYRKLPNAAFAVMPSCAHPIEQVNVELLAKLISDFIN